MGLDEKGCEHKSMSSQIIIPLAISIFSSVVFIWIFLDVVNYLLGRSERIKRINSILSFSVRQQHLRKRFLQGMVRFDLQFQDLSNSLVRRQYRTFLETYSNQVDVGGEKILQKIIRNKTYFALFGLFLTFTLAARNEIRLIPISLFITGLAYLAPSLIKFTSKLAESSYGKRLDSLANFRKGKTLSSAQIFRLKFIAAAVTFALCYLYTLIKNTSALGTLLSVLIVSFSFFIPDIWLYNKVMKRREMFADALPEAIDLLSMCTNSGLAFPAAMVKVAESDIEPVSEEFARVNTEISLGKERSEALREMSVRVKVDSLQEFINAISQVDRFGIPITRALQEQSRELRAKRRARGREKAQKVPIKILGPIMMCFLPCVIIIVLTPAIIGVLAVL